MRHDDSTEAAPRAPSRVDLSDLRIRPLLYSVFAFSLVINLLMLTGPLFMLQIYDRVLPTQSGETLLALFSLVAALFVFMALLDHIRAKVMIRLAANLDALFCTPLLQRYYCDGRTDAADPANFPAALDTLRRTIAAPASLSNFDLPLTPLFFVALFLLHPMLGWFGLAAGVLSLVLAAKIAHAQTRPKRTDALRDLNEQERFALRQLGSSPQLAERRAMQNLSALQGFVTKAEAASWLLSLSKSLRLFLQSAMLALGAGLVLQGALGAGAMIASSILLGRALAPIEQWAGQWPALQKARAAWTLIQRACSQSEPRNAAPAFVATQDPVLSVEALCVRDHSAAQLALSRLDFSLARGEVLGIIGPNGSGKTALAQSIASSGLWLSGDIKLLGVSLRHLAPETRGERMGFVPAQAQFFPGTLARNLGSMEQAPDMQRLAYLAEKTGCADAIANLPEAWSFDMSRASLVLPAGLAQRLSVLRALYHDPDALILDEPYLHLDHDGAQALDEILQDRRFKGQASLILSHSPRAVALCDRLAILTQGRIRAIGARKDILTELGAGALHQHTSAA